MSCDGTVEGKSVADLVPRERLHETTTDNGTGASSGFIRG